MTPGAVVAVALAYVGLLFGTAWAAERSAARGRPWTASPTVYALSLAVYCTAWTFYGSVGRAAEAGYAFLPVYLGPTLAAVLWGVVVRRLVRVCRYHGLTSPADLAAARYGRSRALGALVALVSVAGIVPYVALQLRAVATTFDVLTGSEAPGAADATAAWVAVGMAAFTMLFTTRRLDAAERHEGMVAAVALESVVKLAAFLAAGAFVVWGLFDGPAALVEEAAARPDTAALLALPADGWLDWTALTLLSALAVILLPRQFQVAVVEVADERALDRATWLFPLYLLLINLFVLPVALAGRLRLPPGADADTFVLALPLVAGQDVLALAVFVGGLSAATGMVIVATTALASMISTHLAVPLLLRAPDGADLSGRLRLLRRAAIAVVVALAWAYASSLAERTSLVSIGLISFAAVAQLAPALLGGLWWSGATRAGALAGVVGGAAVWAWTLPLPTLVDAGWLDAAWMTAGPAGLAWLRPHALFGLDGMDPLTHSLVWSALVNVGLFVSVSVARPASAADLADARLFVRASGAGRDPQRRTAPVEALAATLTRFLGPMRAAASLAAYRRRRPSAVTDGVADAALVQHAEALLAGALGPASARVVVERVATRAPAAPDEVLSILDEAHEARALAEAHAARGRTLDRQRAALEAAAVELRDANARLEELDRLKDDFVATVSHELRTPLTAIRAFSEILHANPDLAPERRAEFTDVLIRESERLSRLIESVLTLQRPSAGPASDVDLASVASDAARLAGADGGPPVTVDAPAPVTVHGNRDALEQALLNLLSNARKMVDPAAGRVSLAVRADAGRAVVTVDDDGPGVHPDDRERIFESFRQAERGPRVAGTGLGLAIVRRIARAHGGDVTVADAPLGGARFTLDLPLRDDAA